MQELMGAAMGSEKFLFVIGALVLAIFLPKMISVLSGFINVSKPINGVEETQSKSHKKEKKTLNA